MSHNQMKKTESIENGFNGKHINSGSTAGPEAIAGEIPRILDQRLIVINTSIFSSPVCLENIHLRALS